MMIINSYQSDPGDEQPGHSINRREYDPEIRKHIEYRLSLPFVHRANWKTGDQDEIKWLSTNIIKGNGEL